MEQNELENSNRAKYGEKEFDLISQNYRKSKEIGDTWCSSNVIRYLDRYTRPGSTKAGNHTDLLKAFDYLQRMIDKSQESSLTSKTEKIE